MSRFWLRAAVVYLVGAALLLWLFGADWRTALELTLIAAGLLPEIVRRTPSLYLRWHRLKYFISNKETTWTLGARFVGQFDHVQVSRFANELAASEPRETVLLEATDIRLLLRYRRVFTIEMLLLDDPLTPASDGTTLAVTVFDQVVSYRRSERMLEDALLPFIERLRSAFNPVSAVYSLRVKFEGPNPFFGLYVQQLRAELIDSFQFDFHLPSSGPQEYVSVGREHMTVVAQSPDRFRRAVLAGLSFSAVVS